MRVYYVTCQPLIRLNRWQESLSNSLRRAPRFYGVLAAATLLGTLGWS